ncbi:MAG TPA: HRDC domain-containing protein [Candidatus Acidoferrales bacterium]|nr:HRDC domain-containing protein [Candidatus Acidoferrales bacterium]
MVSDASALASLCARIADAPRVGLDTEFHAERSYTANLMVVQIAIPKGNNGGINEVAIIDPLAVRNLRHLVDALHATTVVGHALTSDLKIFADQFEMLPAAVFDTQLAAAFCGYGLSISLLDLVRDLAKVQLRKSQTVSDWSTRPLSVKQVDYLVDDVRYLFSLQDALIERLRERGRLEWVIEECRGLADATRYRPDQSRLYLKIPGNSRLNRRELGVLKELAVARDRAARERNIPLKYVIPDDAMVGIAQIRPKTTEDLAQLRRLDNGIRRTFGKMIIDAVKRGEVIPEIDLPAKPIRSLTPQRESLVSTMNVLVNAIAAENDLPATLLAPRSALERVARELPQTYDAFVETLGLAPWRRELIVEPLWRFLSGRVPLRIEGYGEGVPRTIVGEP